MYGMRWTRLHASAGSMINVPVKLKSDWSNATDLLVGLACGLLSAGIFAVDVSSLPLGVAAGVLYAAVVLLSLYLPRWQHTVVVAGCVSVLTVFGYFLSEPAGTPWIAVANRTLALALIWVTALTGIRLVHARRRKLEDALRMEYENALKKATQDADRARNVKSRFLGTANDYLRQRLQTLSLLNGTLRKVVAEKAAQDIFAMQLDEVLELQALLDSLLELSELDSGSVEVVLTETPLPDIFMQLRDEFCQQAQAKGLELRFEAGTEVAYSDPELLTRIVRHLIANAILYTDSGVVKVHCRREAGGLRITVEDSGIGIAPDQQGSIFDEFYRVESGPANRSGRFGLGLSIVDRAAQLLGTTIDVQSTVGKGSSFSFLVPSVDAPRRRSLASAGDDMQSAPLAAATGGSGRGQG